MHIASPLIKVQTMRVFKKRTGAAELLARSFMAFTNVASASLVLGSIFLPTYSASTMAASLPEGNHQAAQCLLHGKLVAFEQAAVELPTVAAALLTVTFSSILQFSTVRIAVMTLVIEAILTCSSAPRP